MKSQIEVFWVKQSVRWASAMCDHIPGGENKMLLIVCVCVFGSSTEGLAMGVY